MNKSIIAIGLAAAAQSFAAPGKKELNLETSRGVAARATAKFTGATF